MMSTRTAPHRFYPDFGYRSAACCHARAWMEAAKSGRKALRLLARR